MADPAERHSKGQRWSHVTSCLPARMHNSLPPESQKDSDSRTHTHTHTDQIDLPGGGFYFGGLSVLFPALFPGPAVANLISVRISGHAPPLPSSQRCPVHPFVLLVCLRFFLVRLASFGSFLPVYQAFGRPTPSRVGSLLPRMEFRVDQAGLAGSCECIFLLLAPLTPPGSWNCFLCRDVCSVWLRWCRWGSATPPRHLERGVPGRAGLLRAQVEASKLPPPPTKQIARFPRMSGCYRGVSKERTR